MEKRAFGKVLAVSQEFKTSFDNIHKYTLEEFGVFQAKHYVEKIESAVDLLPVRYLIHSECRHIRTKSQMYRNIILDAHLIIYRVTKERVEVLDIVHSSSSVSKIRSTRQIQI